MGVEREGWGWRGRDGDCTIVLYTWILWSYIVCVVAWVLRERWETLHVHAHVLTGTGTYVVVTTVSTCM